MSTEKEKDKTLPIYQKIQNVIAEMNGVEPKGLNKFQNYNYTKQEDVINGIRPLLIKHGLVVLSDITEENTQYVPEKDSFFTKVKMQFSIIDTDTGEALSKTYYGHGIDKGDKALYKAITGSEKYFYMKNFLIATPIDDPENEQENYYGEKNNSQNNPPEPKGKNDNYKQKPSNNQNTKKQQEVIDKAKTKAAEEAGTKEDKKKTVVPESTINKDLQKALFDTAKGNDEIVRNAISKLNYNSTSQIKLNEYKVILNDIVKQVKALV